MPNRKQIPKTSKGRSKSSADRPAASDHKSVPHISDEILRPQEVIRLEFGRRFQAAMDAKGVRQIDVSNATDIGRDSISGYTRGRVLPDGERLKKICDYLGTTPEDLVPHYGSGGQKTAELMPALSFAANADGNGWLRVNQTVTMEQASRVMEILRKPK